MTTEGQLEWEVDPWNKDMYSVALPAYSASISSEDSDGLQPFHLQLFDSQGQSFEVISSDRNSDGEWTARSADLGSLYEAARRRALNTDAALDGFLGALKMLEEPPF
ncbi:hypothetical protein ACWF76_23540 [Streptomyces globisporus]